MGLFRKKDERAMPEPGTPEFEEAVKGSAIPDSQSVSMGESGWSEPGAEVEQPSQPETDDAPDVRGLTDRILGSLGDAGLQIPNAGGFGGGISPPKQDPKDQVEHLARQRDAGEITEAEFEAQKRELLGD
jgi:putative oligomerization/nucleic acid binding protein